MFHGAMDGLVADDGGIDDECVLTSRVMKTRRLSLGKGKEEEVRGW